VLAEKTGESDGYGNIFVEFEYRRRPAKAKCLRLRINFDNRDAVNPMKC